MEGPTKSEDHCHSTNETGKSKKKSEKKLQDTGKPKTSMKPEMNFEEFLRKKGLSQDFIRTLRRVGLTDEFNRFLRTLGFIDDDIAGLDKLLKSERQVLKETESSEKISSSTEENLSLDGVYLKNALSKPLLAALREIVAKQPFDPVEYLAHWLLHYKISEERMKQRTEFELELTMERERIRMQEHVEEEESLHEDRAEGEEHAEDLNYFNYEGI